VIDEENTVVETSDYRSAAETRRFAGEGGQMPGKKYLTNANTTKEGYTGKERDAETGWDYFGARYYYPAIGRFLAIDPLDFKFPDKTPFHYVSNNPINLIDPTGMEEEDEKKKKQEEEKKADVLVLPFPITDSPSSVKPKPTSSTGLSWLSRALLSTPVYFFRISPV
jgi:RHS repeat-associated protein